jgi:flagellar motor switch protein FliN
MADKTTDDAWADALQEQERAEGKGKKSEGVWGESQTADFQELSDNATGRGGSQNLDFLLDIPLEVTVALGRNTLVINRLLQLTPGSVIELDKAAGETVEIYVNNKLLGKGEVIVINDRFGVRITEIISQADRIKNMG